MRSTPKMCPDETTWPCPCAGKRPSPTSFGHEQNVKAGLNHVLSQRMEASHITVYCGTASFEEAHMVRVRPLADGNPPDLLLRGEHFLIAIGSAPVRTSWPRLDKAPLIR